jgi:hypothetical protein
MRTNDTAVPVTILVLSLMVFGQTAAPPINQFGPYGPWLANDVLGDGPARLSFRTGQWEDVGTWRRAGRKRVLECIAPVNLGGRPVVTVTGPHPCRQGESAIRPAAHQGPAGSCYLA